MPRRNIYFKEAIDQQVQAIVDAEIEKGASHGEVNFSAKVNDLVQKGLWVEQHQGEGNKFDRKAFDIDLIRKVSATREAIPLLLSMVTELYLARAGNYSQAELEAQVTNHITAIELAEKNAENEHFPKGS